MVPVGIPTMEPSECANLKAILFNTLPTLYKCNTFVPGNAFERELVIPKTIQNQNPGRVEIVE